MKKFQFTLRHILLALPVVAVLLVLLRFVSRTPGIAVGLMVAGIAACMLLAANILIYVILRVFGGLSHDGPDATGGHRPSDASARPVDR